MSNWVSSIYGEKVLCYPAQGIPALCCQGNSCRVYRFCRKRIIIRQPAYRPRILVHFGYLCYRTLAGSRCGNAGYLCYSYHCIFILIHFLLYCIGKLGVYVAGCKQGHEEYYKCRQHERYRRPSKTLHLKGPFSPAALPICRFSHFSTHHSSSSHTTVFIIPAASAALFASSPRRSR